MGTNIVEVDDMINIAHNYATLENHFGKNVWVHRKGATSAKEGELGIIPGSQGTKSYIVRGLGNKESFMSCSHGAGRVMGRKQAKRELDLKEEQRKLDEQGILHSIRGVSNLDEATGAYKDINVVMENQVDLAEIVSKLDNVIKQGANERGIEFRLDISGELPKVACDVEMINSILMDLVTNALDACDSKEYNNEEHYDGT